MKRRKLTEAERRRLEAERGVSRQLALGVMHEIQAASFGRVPRRPSPWPMLASLGGWLLVAGMFAGAIAIACAH